MDDLNRLPLPDLFKRIVVSERLEQLLELALDEDLDILGDVTSRSIIPPDLEATAHMTAREAGVVAGLAVVPHVLARFGHSNAFVPAASDGQTIESGTVLGRIRAPLRVVLKAERLVLNLVGHLSGVATLTRAYLQAVAGTRASICDTRKTMPGMRRLEKYATRCGGATLHRLGLFDAALYKDNHLAHLRPEDWIRALSDAAQRVRQTPEPDRPRFVQVEVDTLEQFKRVLEMPSGLIDAVLLDNMSPKTLREAVRLRDERSPTLLLEASGGINLSTVRPVAETGVDRIAVGALTHSAPSLDVGLDIIHPA